MSASTLNRTCYSRSLTLFINILIVEFVRRTRVIKEMQEEIRQEKYNAERQVLLDEKEAGMREVQLEKTWRTLQDHESAFMEYVADAEKKENVNISIFSFLCTG